MTKHECTPGRWERIADLMASDGKRKAAHRAKCVKCGATMLKLSKPQSIYKAFK